MILGEIMENTQVIMFGIKMQLKNFFTRLRKCFWVKVIGNGYIDSNFLLKSTFVVHLLDHGEGKKKTDESPPRVEDIMFKDGFQSGNVFECWA